MKKCLGMVSLFFLFSVLLVPASAFASGFALPEQSTSAMGMASAFVGQADDVSAVWYNPAGLTKLEGTQMSAGVIAIYPSFKHDTTFGFTESIEHKLHTPIHIYGSTKMGDRMALGIGINNPFGLSTTWSPASTTAAVATLSSVRTLNVNPNIAYKISNALSVAVGVDYLMLDATLSSTRLHLTGDGDSLGANASVLYNATDKLGIGFTYRGKAKVEVDGKLANTFSTQTTITLPDEFKMGVSVKTSDNLTVNVEADMTNWSTYNQIVLPPIAGVFPGAVDPKQWQDTWCYRIGGQYRLSDAWKVRAGYMYDTNPVRSEYFETRVPDSDRQGVTIGVGYTSGKLTVDAGYMYLRFKARTINDSIADSNFQVLNGTYRATAHLPAVTIGYKF